MSVQILRSLHYPSVAINSGMAGVGESKRETTNINSALSSATNTTFQTTLLIPMVKS